MIYETCPLCVECEHILNTYFFLLCGISVYFNFQRKARDPYYIYSIITTIR